MRVGLYARVSTYDQHTLPLQIEAMKAYISNRQWKVAMQIEDIDSGAKARPKQEALLQVQKLFEKGSNKSAIAKKLGISRTSVRRFLQRYTIPD